MIGILYYLYFLFIGYTYSCIVFKGKHISHRLWMGGVFGNVILMMGAMLTSLVFNFTIISHLVLLVLSTAPLVYLLLKLKKDDSFNIKQLLTKSNDDEDGALSTKIFVFVILPIVLLIGILLTNHILTPYENGGVASGQSTYGDLQMHLGFATSIAQQGTYPPNYIFLTGHKLSYPFLIDQLSSTLFLFGSSLRCAMLLPSYVISLLLVVGFYMLAYKITNNKAASVLSTVFFFLCGGFGFAYFIEGSKADPTAFTRIFNDFYHTPTNYNDNNIRWANSICDMIIPQRTSMAGWFMFMPTCWLLIDAIKTTSRKSYLTLAVLAGSMPMIHTHTFLALGIISAVLFFAHLPKDDKKEYITNWVIYGAIVGVIAFPQLIYWVFSQTSGNDSFLKPQFNWVNHNDPYIWFYLKNWGIVTLFAFPAIICAPKDIKKLLLGVGCIFTISEFVLFQPNEYDNNKLFFIVYMILLIAVCDFLIKAWYKLASLITDKKKKYTPTMVYLAILVIIGGTLSGVLTIGREWYSGGMYQTFDENKIEMAEWLRENTDPNGVFLTGTSHTNPVTSLAGRSVYVGSSLYVSYHGMHGDFNTRKQEIINAYEGDYENLKKFCTEHNISYIYIGNDEINTQDFSINQDTINKLKPLHSVGNETVYQIQ